MPVPEKPFKCSKDGCSATFCSKYNCMRHENEVHAIGSNYSCPSCKRSFKCADYLAKHLKNVKHSKDVVVIRREKSLESLVRVPIKEPAGSQLRRSRSFDVPDNKVKQCAAPPCFTYTCDDCRQSFRTKTQLKVHVSSHLKKMEPAVTHGYTLRTARIVRELPELEPEPRESEPEKRYPCTLCDRVYTKDYSLQAHMEYRHEKLEGNGYWCDFCKAHFTYKVNLEFHIVRRHLARMN